MYRSVSIRYKMMFKYDYGNETCEYKAKGILLHGKNTTLSFECEAGTIEVIYNQKEVILNHGKSKLAFYYDKERWNDYYVQYGSIKLKTKLLMFEANDSMIKMKYELYDQSGLLSTSYMLIPIQPYHFNEE